MLTLALDTCLGACSVALSSDDQMLAYRTEPMTRGHQERLPPMVREVMAAAGAVFEDLDRVGVTVGPGSFTGLRVGLAFAKGLGLALEKPCVGVGTLEALAASFEGAGPRAAVVDAGRGRIYLQVFDGHRALTPPEVLSMDAAVTRLVEMPGRERVALVGPGIAALSGMVAAGSHLYIVSPSPRAVAELAARAPVVSPSPLYLRAPDAKVKGA